MTDERIRRIMASTLRSAIFILIPIVTIALVGLAQGYRLDLKSGRVITGGLLQIGSDPRGAAIIIDGEDTGETTPERLVLAAGEYDIVLRRGGYRSWQKSVTVLSSEVTWVQYPVLLPDSVSTNTYKTLSRLRHFEQSPDKKFIAFSSQDATSAKVEVLATNAPDTEPRLVYRLPSDLRGKATINKLLWASDSEHLLVELKLKGSTKQILVDGIGDDEVVDITKELQLPLADLRFDEKNWRELYWLSPEGLRRLDLAANTVSAALADKVVDYTVTEEGIFMIRRHEGALGVYQLQRDDRLRTIKNDFDNQHKLNAITYLDFDGTRHVALVNQTQHQVTLVSGIDGDRANSRDISFDAKRLMVSPKERYLLMRAGTDFAAFDLDLGRLHRFSLGVSKASQLSWYDKTHLLVTADSSVNLLEYDGGNQEGIVDGVDGFVPYGSENGKFVYSVGRSSVSHELLIHVSEVVD